MRSFELLFASPRRDRVRGDARKSFAVLPFAAMAAVMFGSAPALAQVPAGAPGTGPGMAPNEPMRFASSPITRAVSRKMR